MTRNIIFFISLLCAMALSLSSCGGSGSRSGAGSNDAASNDVAASNIAVSDRNVAQNPDLDKLWTMLSGYWRISMPDVENVFYYFGYNEDKKPICYVVWYHENDETEYVTNVKKINNTRFKVTIEVPPNKEEGLHEVHDGYTATREFDVSRYDEKVLTIISSEDNSSVWIFNSKTADGRTFENF